MIFNLKQPHLTITGFNPKITNQNRNFASKFLILPPLSKSNPKTKNISAVTNSKPLHVVSLIQSCGLLKRLELDDRRVVCKAYEADRSDGVEKIEAAKRVKIGVYFATWWFLNVIFNIYNKKVLNAFPYTWLTSTLSLAAGSAIMLISWATKVAEAPNTDLEFWKSLFPENKSFCFPWFLKMKCF